jgi:hypothetical protein
MTIMIVSVFAWAFAVGFSRSGRSVATTVPVQTPLRPVSGDRCHRRHGLADGAGCARDHCRRGTRRDDAATLDARLTGAAITGQRGTVR